MGLVWWKKGLEIICMIHHRFMSIKGYGCVLLIQDFISVRD